MDFEKQPNDNHPQKKIKSGLAGKIALLIIIFSIVGIAVSGIVSYLMTRNVLINQNGADLSQILSTLGLMIVVASLVIIGIVIPFAIGFGKKMVVPVIKLNAVFQRMALGETDFDLQLLKEFTVMPEDELGQMMASFIAMVDNRKHLADAAESLASGDLTVAIRPQSQKDVLAYALINIIDQLNRLYAEMEKTGSEIAGQGNFDFKGDPSVLAGSYQDFIVGINTVVAGLVEPLRTASDYLNQFGTGKIPEKISATYHGDFNLIKDSINTCIDGLGALSEGNTVMVYVSKNDFSRKVEGRYMGIFDELARSINLVVDQFRHVVVATNSIARGDLSILEDLKQYGKQSDGDTLIPAQIEMIETILRLVQETQAMTEYAIKGDLSYRGNVTQFNGEYAKVIDGFNQTLDAVIAPITEASKALTELSKGNLSAEMAGDYAGDHAEVKKALNKTTKFLKRYVDEITNTLKEIQQGNLNREITSFYQGDFFEIKMALNDITTHLSATMTDINVAATQVEIGAQQISSGGQALSRGATQQASAIEELTASIEEVAQETKKNAVNANQADTITTKVHENAGIGNSQMQKMIVAMDEINGASQNISKIIKVIDDIAFQTNILALNAAVEAARAGQHGKGFAVVAEEVRTLAARSSEAAKETASLIESSIRKVSTGAAIADNTAVSLNEILQEIEKVAGIVKHIAEASNEQASEIAQINQGIEQVSQVVQTTSATAEESAAASEELTGQAEMLKQMVGSFKLKDQEQIGRGMVAKKSDSISKKPQKQTTSRIILNNTKMDKY
ncbi:methyl-accepting chemotaxis protein [Acetobacterium carbinolicum]|uniref:methyl-accepting chemotaxis protein n=1 Tax=Acetobacterium carbinolicum TaxID=52690 RepID=UPI0039C90CC9